MNLFFSDRPGAHERHVRRKVNNPLFGNIQITQDDIQRARERDELELQSFLEQFHALAKDASQFDANVDADKLIELKQRLEHCYEQSCMVMGSMNEIQQAISRLIDSIMKSLLYAAKDDEDANTRLLDEFNAKARHFELLQHKLIADLLHPDSPITSADLVPVLLSASEKAASAASQLFTEEQLSFVCQQARIMLEGIDSEHSKIIHARKIVQLLESEHTRMATVTDSDIGSSDSGGLAS